MAHEALYPQSLLTPPNSPPPTPPLCSLFPAGPPGLRPGLLRGQHAFAASLRGKILLILKDSGISDHREIQL